MGVSVGLWLLCALAAVQDISSKCYLPTTRAVSLSDGGVYHGTSAWAVGDGQGGRLHRLLIS